MTVASDTQQLHCSVERRHINVQGRRFSFIVLLVFLALAGTLFVFEALFGSNSNDVEQTQVGFFGRKNSKQSSRSNNDEGARSTLNFRGDTPSMTNPIWVNATDEFEAAYLLSNGVWIKPSAGQSLLNAEELNFLIWAEKQMSTMTVEQAGGPSPDAFSSWNATNTSLYGTAESLSLKYCRLSRGYRSCDPLNHGFDYHGTHWSTARGSELIESFVQLSEDGRANPSMIMMGDSTVHETYIAGLCSLARANVSFVKCQKSLGIDQFKVDTKKFLASSQVCFEHSRIEGIGVFTYLNDREFDKEKWRRVISGCTDLVNCQEKKLSETTKMRWDVIMANLGVHYNLRYNQHNEELGRYKGDLRVLFQFMIQQSKHQFETAEPFPTLHLFWGTYPQHFAHTVDGSHQGKKFKSRYPTRCASVYPSVETFGSNRFRSDVAWEVMIHQLTNMTGVKCDESISHDLSHISTKTALQNQCMTKLLNTCQGGMMHMEMEPFMTDRPDAHPGAKLKHKDIKTDCTHHCWGPLLFHPIWERLEIAVKFHLDRCSVK